MCHKLDLEPRLSLPGPTLPASDLLLLKLQVVELNEKDVTDALALLLQFEPTLDDGPASLSARYIARLCGSHWGWYATLQDNLAAVRERAILLKSPSDAAVVRARVEGLLAAIESTPKSMSWRLRDKIGRRVVWYELPEAVRH